MSFLSPSIPSAPQNPTPPSMADPAVEEARRKQIEAQKRAKGRSSTILTGGQGDTTAPELGKKQLLGQ